MLVAMSVAAGCGDDTAASGFSLTLCTQAANDLETNCAMMDAQTNRDYCMGLGQLVDASDGQGAEQCATFLNDWVDCVAESEPLPPASDAPGDCDYDHAICEATQASFMACALQYCCGSMDPNQCGEYADPTCSAVL